MGCVRVRRYAAEDTHYFVTLILIAATAVAAALLDTARHMRFTFMFFRALLRQRALCAFIRAAATSVLRLFDAPPLYLIYYDALEFTSHARASALTHTPIDAAIESVLFISCCRLPARYAIDTLFSFFVACRC